MNIEYLDKAGLDALWAKIKNTFVLKSDYDALVARVDALENSGTGTSKLFSFGLFSDIHISTTRQSDYPNGEKKFRKGLEFCKEYKENYGLDFVTVNGDISVEQLNDEFNIFKTIRNDYASCFPIYANAGNHDMGRVVPFGDSSNSNVVHDNATWKNYTGQDINFYFPYTAGGKKFYFIFLSCKIGIAGDGATETTSLYKAEDVTNIVDGIDKGWLTETLAACSDGQCFVYVHAPLPERCNFGLSYWANSLLLGTALTQIRNLSSQYKDNTIWIHGHTHWAWENQGVEYKKPYVEESGNDPYGLVLKGAIDKQMYDAYDKYNNNANLNPVSNEGRTHGWHLHIPSNCIARFYPTDSDARDKKRSQFAIVDVYKDYAIVKGCSFDNTNDNSEIEFVSNAQYRLDFKTNSSGSGSTDTGGSTGGDTGGGGSTTTSSYIDETNKIIYGFVGETLDLGWTPDDFRAQNYEIYGASSNTLSYSNRISMSGSKMSFIGTANKNWSSGISGSIDGLASSSNESGCWFWTYKSESSNIKYKTIIK